MNLKEAAAYFGVLLVHSRIDCEGLHQCQTMMPPKMGWRANPPGLKGVDDKQQIEARSESTSSA